MRLLLSDVCAFVLISAICGRVAKQLTKISSPALIVLISFIVASAMMRWLSSFCFLATEEHRTMILMHEPENQKGHVIPSSDSICDAITAC